MTQEDLLRTLESCNPKFKEEMLLGSYEDEEFTDEGRTNEEQYSGQNYLPNSTKYGAFGHDPKKNILKLDDDEGSDRFYGDGQGSGESSGDQQESEDQYYEEGEIDPSIQDILAQREDSMPH